MSARAIASVTVSFGLVSIPVKVYSSGESSSGIHFNMLHKKCGSRVKQQYFCPQDDEIVPRGDLAKGYEFAKGQYVMFSDEELKALEERATQTVEITEFLATDKIDPIYFDKSYYLGPDKGGDRAYRLLTEALSQSGRSALAKYAARGKQYLVLLRPVQNALVMQQLRYADEIRPVSEVPLGDALIKPEELKLALQIVDQAVADEFRPADYQDDVRRRIQFEIDKKVGGQEITLEPSEEPRAQVIDLMAALRSSLAEKTASRRPAKRASGETVGDVATPVERKAGGKKARTSKG